MRKVVSVLLSAAMALSLCAGCSSSSSDTADTKAAEEKGADAADTDRRRWQGMSFSIRVRCRQLLKRI